jgi:hypothetical protein
MYKSLKRFLIVILFLQLTSVLTAQVAYEVRAVQNTATVGFLRIDIEIRSTGATPFQLGTSSFVFNYNTSGLHAATLAGQRKVAANDGPWDSATDDDFADVSTSAPSAGIISLIVDISGSGTDAIGAEVPSTFTRIGTLQLIVDNVASSSQLTWRNIGINTAVQMFAAPGVDYSMTNITANGTFIAPDDAPLPVELVAFNAIANGRNVELTWKTATETNNAGFEIERKQEGTDWAKVGYVEGNGSKATESGYSYKDAVKTADKFQYRLKQIDRDGNFSYSAQVEAITTLTAEDYKLSSNYPNPFNPSTKFNFALKTAGPASVKIYNGIGQEVATLFNDVAQANQVYEMNFNAANLASGTYFYVLRAKDRNDVKKMLLMK